MRPLILRKIAYVMILAGLVLAGLAPAAVDSYAQGPEPSPTPASTGPAAPEAEVPAAPSEPAAPVQDANRFTLSFGDLDSPDTTVQGPYEKEDLRFGLPAGWELTPGAQVQLDLATSFSGPDVPADETVQLEGGQLELVFNGTPLTSVFLTQAGEQTVTASIPETALASSRNDGRHQLTLVLDSPANCRLDFQTSVEVLPSSQFILPYQVSSPAVDLRQFPRPIYQDSFLGDTAVIVVPESPNRAELQAALTVAAGLGQMTSGRLALSLIPANELTQDIRSTNHLVFIGRPSGLADLEQVTFTTPAGEAGFQALGAAKNDGIVQMAISPWNQGRVVLLVSGSTDEAIIKAGQALSSGSIRTTDQANVAVVTQVQTEPEEISAEYYAADRTFAELGYLAETGSSKGTNWFEYTFNVPSGYLAGNGAYLELSYLHSALLDYDQSGMVVRLNNNIIGSTSFSEETVQPGKIQYNIPRYALRAGPNLLMVQTELVPVSECTNPNLAGWWTTIQPDSLLHLPLTPVEGTIKEVFDLGNYPNPFSLDATLRDTAFVLPPNDPAAWDVAVQIASDLGNRANITLGALTVAIDGHLPEELRNSHHVLIIGQPASLPIIAELGQALPAPFEDGSNLAVERGLPVVYRLPEEAGIGYLETLSLPWDRSRTGLAVLGSNTEGLRRAGAALTDPQLQHKLEGNFVVTDGEQIVTGSRHFQADPDILLPAAGLEQQDIAPIAKTGGGNPAGQTLPEAQAASSSINRPTPPQQPDWLLPALAISIVSMIVVALVGLVIAWRQRSQVS